jgi:rubrerythrin
MSVSLNASEVFEMATRSEHNATAFYRKAASQRSEKGAKDLFLRLAAMEEGHERTFAALKQQLTREEADSDTYDPDSEASLYLAATADMHSGEGSPAAAAALTGKETLAQVLRIAVDLERQAVLFYVGIQAIVPPNRGQDKVKRIISDEMSHVAVLTKELQRLKA